MFRSILVPLDGSQHARQALFVACHLLPDDGGTLHLLHVPEPFTHETLMVWDIGPVTLESTQEEREWIGQLLLTRATDAAREQGASRIEADLVRGDPARAILEEARRRGVDAIVLGSRGLSDLQGFVVGSVSHKVAHAAESTVITVR